MENDSILNWSVDSVIQFLVGHDPTFKQFEDNLKSNEVDGETMLGLTENMVSKLFPKIKYQVKFFKILQSLRETFPEYATTTTTATPINTSLTLPSWDDESDTSNDVTNNNVIHYLHSLTERPMQSFITIRPIYEDDEYTGAELLDSDDYQLPKFHGELADALESKDCSLLQLKSRTRKLLVNSIYHDLRKRKIMYPSHQLYSEICNKIRIHYPYLSDVDGSFLSWRNALRTKFKKSRAKLIATPMVIEMKKKYGRSRPRRKKSIDSESDIDYP